jgi:hypothetical protein
MKVVCIDDTKQPIGGQVVKGTQYEVLREFINNFDQKVFIIAGITNEGRTAMGLPWIGYNANRFADLQALQQTYDHSYSELQLN